VPRPGFSEHNASSQAVFPKLQSHARCSINSSFRRNPSVPCWHGAPQPVPWLAASRKNLIGATHACWRAATKYDPQAVHPGRRGSGTWRRTSISIWTSKASFGFSRPPLFVQFPNPRLFTLHCQYQLKPQNRCRLPPLENPWHKYTDQPRPRCDYPILISIERTDTYLYH